MPDAVTVPESPIRRSRSREIKRSAVISAARQARTVSRAELTQMTGLSPATLTPLVRDLISEGYLIDAGAEAAQPGRPRAMLEFNPAAELVVAVSLEAGGISCELADSDGSVLAHSDIERSGDVTEAICQATLELAGEQRSHLRGVAVAVPGVSTGDAVRLAPSVGLVDPEPIGEAVADRLGVPVVVDNDVNLMAAGEHSAGAGADVDDLILLHVTDGVGAAVVLDGKVRRGASGAAGEVGFVPYGTMARHAEGVGPFEGQWSESALARKLAHLRDQRDLPADPIAELIEGSRTDDDVAALLDQTIEAWAQLIVTCACLIDPGRVLLSGAAAQLDDDTLARLQEKVSEGAPASTDVRPAALGQRAVLHGAVASALYSAGLVSPRLSAENTR